MANPDLLSPELKRKLRGRPKAVVRVDGKGIHEERVVYPGWTNIIDTGDILGAHIETVMAKRAARATLYNSSLDDPLEVTKRKPKAQAEITIWRWGLGERVERRRARVNLRLVVPKRK